MSQLDKDVEVLSKFLVQAEPSALVKILYIDSVKTKVREFNQMEQNLWAFLMRRPQFIDCVDSALALIDRWNPIRHRIYLLNSILEVQPEFTSLYMPIKKTYMSRFGFLFKIFFQFLKIIPGLIIILFFKICTIV